MCNYEEFLLLNRHIEPEKFIQENVEKIFLENADLTIDGEKNLSFNQFSIICVENNLFTDEQQNKYLKINNDDDLKILWENLKKNWDFSLKNTIIERFNSISHISKEENDKWINIIGVLEEKIKDKNIEKNVKPLLIAFKILELESEALCESQENSSFSIV